MELTIEDLGWGIENDGISIRVETSQGPYRVYIPLDTLKRIFQRELQKCGVSLPHTVGACYTVGGFFSGLKKLGKKAWKGTKKGVSAVTRTAHKAADVATFGGARHVRKFAKKYGRKAIRNKYFRHGLKGAALAMPALAPVAAGVETAYQWDKRVSSAKRALKSPKSAVREGLKYAAGQDAASRYLGGDRSRGVVRAMKRADRARRRLSRMRRPEQAFQQFAQYAPTQRQLPMQRQLPQFSWPQPSYFNPYQPRQGYVQTPQFRPGIPRRYSFFR